MIKTVIAIAVLAVASVGVSFGGTITCATGISLSVGGASPTISCGTLKLGDFSLFASLGNSSGRLDINAVTEDTTTGTVVLNEDPNLGAWGNLGLSFVVWGGVDQLDLSVGGSAATTKEIACSSTSREVWDPCSSPVASLTVKSSTVNQPKFSDLFPATSPLYVFKDFYTTGGELTNVNESFHTPVPEPGSFALLGVGLAAIATVRRWRKA